MIKKLLLIVWAGILAGTLTAQAQNWTLSQTKTYGAGGAWENGQKVRIDRSYRSGTFSFERKVSEGKSLDIYSSKGIFSALKKEYAPGEAVTVDMTVSSSGSASAAPVFTYGRVTLIPDAPAWSNNKLINGTGTVDGQLTATNGDAVASPATGETAKLQLGGTMPSTGSQLAIIFSCNGMDVVHTYTRDASLDTPAVEEKPQEFLVEEKEEIIPAEEDFGRDYPEPVPDELVTVGLPLRKILLLAGILILAVVDVIWMFRKRRK